MKTLKTVSRIILLTFFIAIAAAGGGMLGALNLSTRERYMDKPITIEQVDKKKEENEDEEDERKE